MIRNILLVGMGGAVGSMMRYGSAALYIAASLICCLIGCFIGYKLKN